LKYRVTRKGVTLYVGAVKEGFLRVFFGRIYVKDRDEEMIKVQLFLSSPDREKPDCYSPTYLSVQEFKGFYEHLYAKLFNIPMDFKLLEKIRS